jgi:hypothetical protein
MRTAEVPITKSIIETKENAGYWNYWKLHCHQDIYSICLACLMFPWALHN